LRPISRLPASPGGGQGWRKAAIMPMLTGTVADNAPVRGARLAGIRESPHIPPPRRAHWPVFARTDLWRLCRSRPPAAVAAAFTAADDAVADSARFTTIGEGSQARSPLATHGRILADAKLRPWLRRRWPVVWPFVHDHSTGGKDGGRKQRSRAGKENASKPHDKSPSRFACGRGHLPRGDPRSFA
jgi:hypothetical protein